MSDGFDDLRSGSYSFHFEKVILLLMHELFEQETLQCFSILKDVLAEHSLLDSPAQIYVDETGMPLDHQPQKVMTLRGQKI